MRARWLYSDTDERAHVLDEDSGAVATICQQTIPDTIPVYQIAPSMNVCPHCGLSAPQPFQLPATGRHQEPLTTAWHDTLERGPHGEAHQK